MVQPDLRSRRKGSTPSKLGCKCVENLRGSLSAPSRRNLLSKMEKILRRPPALTSGRSTSLLTPIQCLPVQVPRLPNLLNRSDTKKIRRFDSQSNPGWMRAIFRRRLDHWFGRRCVRNSNSRARSTRHIILSRFLHQTVEFQMRHFWSNQVPLLMTTQYRRSSYQIAQLNLLVMSSVISFEAGTKLICWAIKETPWRSWLTWD